MLTFVSGRVYYDCNNMVTNMYTVQIWSKLAYYVGTRNHQLCHSHKYMCPC